MDDLKILENSRLFAGIRVDEIQPMLSCLQAVERKYPRGAYIFHTGEEVRAPYDWWIWFVNERCAEHAKVLAADVPSGLSAQTGKAADPCVEADLTVTMIVQKTGLALPEAARYCGKVEVAPLASVESLLDGLAGA